MWKKQMYMRRIMGGVFRISCFMDGEDALSYYMYVFILYYKLALVIKEHVQKS